MISLSCVSSVPSVPPGFYHETKTNFDFVRDVHTIFFILTGSKCNPYRNLL